MSVLERLLKGADDIIKTYKAVALKQKNEGRYGDYVRTNDMIAGMYCIRVLIEICKEKEDVHQ